MVTLLGFFCILFNVGLLCVMMPDLEGPAPSWVYYSFAFGLFMYQTFDNVDGKQARRTGTSSGLGELFDHGIDSLNCTLASLLETAAMGLGTSKSGVFTALAPCLAMFFSTWETYHTHTLYLGFINGPTEGLLIACAMMIASGYYGPGIWTQPLTPHLPTFFTRFLQDTLRLSDDAVATLSFRDFWVTILLSSLLLTHIPFCVYHVVRARQSRGQPIVPVFLEWTPMAVYTFCAFAWLYSPHSTICKENHLVLFCVVMSFVFGRMTTKMILAHLTRQPFPYWTVMLWPLVGGAVLANLPLVFGERAAVFNATSEWCYLVAYLAFAAVAYFRWAYIVTTSICRFLGINCLTIPHEKQRQNELLMNGLGAPHGKKAA
jgi:ethanolaminephosphotransferase